MTGKGMIKLRHHQEQIKWSHEEKDKMLVQSKRINISTDGSKESKREQKREKNPNKLNKTDLSSVKSHTCKYCLGDSCSFQFITYPLVDFGRHLCVG